MSDSTQPPPKPKRLPLPVVIQALEQFSQAANTAARQQSFPCASGCSHCCHKPIPVSVAEVEIIARYVRQSDPEAQAKLRDRITNGAKVIAKHASPAGYAKAAETNIVGLTLLAEQIAAASNRTPCPFASDGSGRATCLIHAVRPFECRAHFAMGPDACARPQARVPVLDVRNVRMRVYRELQLVPIGLLATELEGRLGILFGAGGGSGSGEEAT